MVELTTMIRSSGLLILLTLASTAMAQNYPSNGIMSDKQTLAGITRMAVAEKLSIPGYSLRGDAEGALRRAGISVLSSTDSSPVYPALRVVLAGTIVNNFRPPQLNYRIDLEFIQLLSFNSGKSIKAVTWSKTEMGLIPWGGVESSPQLVAQARKGLQGILNDFLDDWREANGVSSAATAAFSHLFDGVWKGTYTCAGGFGGSGQSTWSIREVRPGKIEADEQWVRFMSGHNTYTGTISGRSLDVKTGDMGGYEVQFTLSNERRTLWVE